MIIFIDDFVEFIKISMTVLPQEFAPIESLLQRMTINQADGSKGLLASGYGRQGGQFGEAVTHELKPISDDLLKKVKQAIASGNQVSRK